MNGKAVRQNNRHYANEYLRREGHKFFWRMVAIIAFAIVLNIVLIIHLDY